MSRGNNIFKAREEHKKQYPNMHQFPVGSTVWYVPTRFWEDDEYGPEMYKVVNYKRPNGDIIPMDLDGATVYVYSETDGHPVFLKRAECYPTEELAREAQLQMKDIFQKFEDEALDALMDHIDADVERGEDLIKSAIENILKDVST